MTTRLVHSSLIACGLLLGASALAGCAGGSGGTTPQTGFDAAPLLAQYAQNVVLATYATLDTNAAALETAVDAFLASPDATTLAAAQEAWRNARAPWEHSEASLFGPVSNLGLDPALDSWPVNRTDLDNVLASATPLNETTLATLDDPLRGFHTVEYLLFDNGGGSKASADILIAITANARRRQYLDAASADLANNAERLHDAWRASSGDFVGEFLTAGTGSTLYPSQRAAMQEIVEGMKTICDEVANGKINDPVSQADGTLEESQFSDNSLNDFANNITGARNAYLGSFDGSAHARGFTQFVRAEDAALDAQVRTALADAISAIEAIPTPFRTAIFDPGAQDEIAAAQVAINQVVSLLDAGVSPLIDDTDFEH